MPFAKEEVVSKFREHFGGSADPALYRAPGRVNLIGEHTDYNLGFVLPIALEMSCYAAIAPALHGCLRIYSREMEEEVSVPAAGLGELKPTGTWADYVLGVARELKKDGLPVGACDLYIASEVPTGSGLSSSASLEIAAAVALLGARELPPVELARLGRRSESNFVGMPCGIMDQYASVFGRAGAAIQIDCRALSHEYVPLPSAVRIVAVNSMVKHELGSSAYRERVKQCQAAVAAIQMVHPEVQSLRDVSCELFEEVEDRIPPLPRKRARHIVSENRRVLDLASASRGRDLDQMGRLFVASHRSMQHDYEISCEEIDFLVETALGVEGVYGARLTGGGFGGCTVNLVAPAAVERFEERLSAAYRERFGLTPIFYHCKPAAGAGPVSVGRAVRTVQLGSDQI
ncbi:MAG: galactokinase [Bryobacteraceae bacterium]